MNYKDIISKYKLPEIGFIKGVGSVLNIGGSDVSFSDGSIKPAQNDYNALYNDWSVVGGDILAAASLKERSSFK